MTPSARPLSRFLMNAEITRYTSSPEPDMKPQRAKWPVILTIVGAVVMYLHARPTASPKTVALTIAHETPIELRLARSLGSRGSKAGEPFSARLAKPISLNNQVVIPEGAEFSGKVTVADPAGRLAGGARLGITLTSFTLDGKAYAVQTTRIVHVSQGRGKRTAELAGGGAALGTVIGALAGGGKGALIGAAVGAGAGTVGSAETGRLHDIMMPAESLLTFRLVQDVVITPKPAPQPPQTSLTAMIQSLLSRN